MKTVVPNVSLIIPVYNVEQYLLNAWNPLRRSLKGFEVILVDDGSTDHSWKSCVDLPQISNTCVIHQENGGVSSEKRRDSGCQGEYIAFMDSDDYIAPLYLQRLYESAKKYRADMVCWLLPLQRGHPRAAARLSSGEGPGNPHAQGNDRALILNIGIKRFYLEQAVAADSFTEHHHFSQLCALRTFRYASRVLFFQPDCCDWRSSLLLQAQGQRHRRFKHLKS